MHFGGFAVVVEEVVIHVVDDGNMAEFFGGCALQIFVAIDIFDDFAFWILLIAEEVGE